jgi:hypothetical protein
VVDASKAYPQAPFLVELAKTGRPIALCWNANVADCIAEAINNGEVFSPWFVGIPAASAASAANPVIDDADREKVITYASLVRKLYRQGLDDPRAVANITDLFMSLCCELGILDKAPPSDKYKQAMFVRAGSGSPFGPLVYCGGDRCAGLWNLRCDDSNHQRVVRGGDLSPMSPGGDPPPPTTPEKT